VAATSCGWLGYASEFYSEQTVLYWIRVAVVVDVNKCNGLRFEQVNCDYSWIFPATGITPTWCSAYPSQATYTYYANTYAGLRYTLTTVYSGMSCSLTYSIDPTHEPTLYFYNVRETC
jgi:hypothetical protein